VTGRDAVLRARGTHPDHFLRAEIRGDEGQPADPCRNRSPRQEEIVAGAHIALQGKADAQHEDEVDQHDQPVDESQLHTRPACLIEMPETLPM